MRVLIVDDDRDVRELLVESFRLSGFDVVAAANGLEALLYVKREPPDAVVLDLMMPRLGGVEALKRIRSYNPGIRVLVVLLVFAVGIAVGQALHDNPTPNQTVTFGRTIHLPTTGAPGSTITPSAKVLGTRTFG